MHKKFYKKDKQKSSIFPLHPEVSPNPNHQNHKSRFQMFQTAIILQSYGLDNQHQKKRTHTQQLQTQIPQKQDNQTRYHPRLPRKTLQLHNQLSAKSHTPPRKQPANIN